MTLLKGPEVLPNLIIAGVTKGGTTSLFHYLGQHPGVCASSNKEARYFTELIHGEPLPPLTDYARLFAHGTGQRYRMEATPNYFSGGETVAGAIDRLLPRCQVIVSFRDPVQRCWSYYRFVRSTARIPKDLDFSSYLDRCTELEQPSAQRLPRRHPYGGLRLGCYDQWIDAWLETFGDRLRVVFFEDLVARPQEVVETLCRWLDLDPEVCADFTYHVENRTVQYKNRRMQLLALAVNRSGERFFLRSPALKRALRGAYYRVNADAGGERMDPRCRERLMAYYAPHNARLAASLIAAGRHQLPEWLATAP